MGSIALDPTFLFIAPLPFCPCIQDPYHGEKQAMGLSFSVQKGTGWLAGWLAGLLACLLAWFDTYTILDDP